MTPEQKAKAYDEALEKAKQIIVEYDYDEHNNVFMEIFPELKESEDERVRKAILELVRQSSEVLDKQNQNNMIAWLEKQKESYTKKDVDDAYLKGISDAKNELEKQGEQKDICGKCKKAQPYHSCQDITALGRCYIEGMNTANKDEPKFHEGEWITNGDYTWKIVEVKPLDYILQSQNGSIVDDTIFHVNEQFHSFTIKDAKDGDVLASDNSIFIFREEYIAGKPIAYCGLMNGLFIEGENACWTNEKCNPATKEQRDTLMKAMADAGWGFDFEKKELKKIEQKSQRMVSAEAKEALYDKPTDEEMKELLRTEYEKGRADVLRCIDPDEMVADFCSQPLSKTRSLASIYRQGIIDIVKRINNNEETSINSTHSIDDGGVRFPRLSENRQMANSRT